MSGNNDVIFRIVIIDYYKKILVITSEWLIFPYINELAVPVI